MAGCLDACLVFLGEVKAQFRGGAVAVCDEEDFLPALALDGFAECGHVLCDLTPAHHPRAGIALIWQWIPMMRSESVFAITMLMTAPSANAATVNLRAPHRSRSTRSRQ